MMMNVKVNIVMAMLAAIIVIAGIGAADMIRRVIVQSEPVIEWHGVEVVTQYVQPGGVLEIVYTATVNRVCPADIRGFLVAEDGSVPVRYPTIAGGYTLPSDEPVRIKVSVTVPRTANAGLKPLHDGPYIYRSIATRYCADGVETDTAIPDAPFMLDVPE